MPLGLAMSCSAFLIFPCWLLAITSGFAGDVSSVRLEPCKVEGVSGDVRCGTYRVYENREAKSGRSIHLKIVVLGAGAKREPDPLFILAGDPGQPATKDITF